MRKYEFALVLADTDGMNETKLEKTASDLVKEVKGKVDKSNVLGLNELAYPIRKQAKGWYGFFNVSLPEDQVKELDKQIKINEKFLRYLLVKKE